MKALYFLRYALVIYGVVMLAACRGQESTFSPSVATVQVHKQYVPDASTAYAVLFSFGGKNGANPAAGLTPQSAHSGPFFGTTKQGGKFHLGTAYSISTAGQERVLHDFNGGKDGLKPTAGLTLLKGVFFGTTVHGGSGCSTSYYKGCGTVYRLSASGKEVVLYRFKGGTDGEAPTGLTAANGVLYGTTAGGGRNDRSCYESGCGTIFELSTSGAEQVLYRFKGGNDAQDPKSLLFANGSFYGVGGGGGNYCNDYPNVIPCGTVFEVSLSGVEHVLHRFGNRLKDGFFPSAGLVLLNSTLYGVTSLGGSGHCYHYTIGCGTVFSVSESGKVSVLYSFKNSSDGALPNGPLAAAGTSLYGTTSDKGGGRCSCGIIFKVTTTGIKTTLHAFEGAKDGANPLSPLIDLNGTLYGTTYSGGTGKNGTVFALTP